MTLTGSEGPSKKADELELNIEKYKDQNTSFYVDKIQMAKFTCRIGGKVGGSHEEIEKYITSHPKKRPVLMLLFYNI